MVRLFIGISLGDSAAMVADACVRTRESVPSWRDEKWVPAPNLHVTVAFLGDVDDSRIDEVRRVVSAAAGDCERPCLRKGSVTCVPARDRASMVWLEYEDEAGRCADLARVLNRDLCADNDDGKPFRAHTTLVRARRPHSAATLCDVLDAHIHVDARAVSDPVVRLYVSRLTPRGPIYTVVDSWSFGGG